MKISYNWLKEYVKTNLNPEEMAVILTDIGLEVEGVGSFQSVKGGLEGVVIGKIKISSNFFIILSPRQFEYTTEYISRFTPIVQLHVKAL